MFDQKFFVILKDHVDPVFFLQHDITQNIPCNGIDFVGNGIGHQPVCFGKITLPLAVTRNGKREKSDKHSKRFCKRSVS